MTLVVPPTSTGGRFCFASRLQCSVVIAALYRNRWELAKVINLPLDLEIVFCYAVHNQKTISIACSPTFPMSVTLQDVAEASGYSVPTVSRVLSHSNYPVSEATRQRILETAQTLGYAPNLAARSLRTERTGVAGVLVDDIVSPFAPLLVRGIQDALIPHDYTCLIVNSDWSPEIETSAIHGLLQRPVDGIIFAEYSHLARNALLERSGKPHVFVHRLFAQKIANSVVPDDFGGARLAVRHLAELGHTRIGYINGIAGWHSAERRKQGFRAEIEALGLPINDAWVEQSDWEIEGGYAAMGRILALRERPTALFAANDFLALGAIYAIQDAGLSVPDDFAIVGYDNRDFARFVRPRITTVEMPVYEMGRAAAELLLQQIHFGGDAREEIRIQGKLFVRESSGADPAKQTREDRLTVTDERRRLLNRQPD